MFKKSTIVLGVSNAFSAGVFLSIAIIHILPESYGEYHKAVGGDSVESFPVPFLIAICSYSFVLFIEKIAFHSGIPSSQSPQSPQKSQNSKEKRLEKDPEGLGFVLAPDSSPSQQNKRGFPPKDEKQEDLNEEIFKMFMNYREKVAFKIREINDTTILDYPETFVRNLEELQGENMINSQRASASQRGSVVSNKAAEKLDETEEDNLPPSEKLGIQTSGRGTDRSFDIDSHLAEVEHQQKQLNAQEVISFGQKLRPFMFLLALCFHSIIQGIACGLQKSSSGVFNLIAAMALHKWAEALTLGISFRKNQIHKSMAVLMVIIFSLAGPFGVVFGILLSGFGSVFSSILMSAATGIE